MKSKKGLALLIIVLAFACKENQKEDNSNIQLLEDNKIENLNSENKQLVISRDHLETLMSKTTDKFPSYNPNYPPPSGAKEVFQLSQDYPKTFTPETYPWLAHDFKTKPNDYIKAVLNYCLEGNIEVDFKGQSNQVRKWYHAPWMHDDGNPIGNGREYIHGLTRERGTPKFEIHDKQDVRLENWAVGMYSAPGGFTIGNVWSSPDVNPDPTKAQFPEGTVTFKLLFTDGAVDKVPFLDGSLQWQANIYECGSNSCKQKGRINRTVSLLQIDVAVKDKRALKTGWVFGTFMYDASASGNTVWEKMVPVGLSWGDDANVKSDLNKDGAFVNKDLKETYLNPNLIEDKTKTYTNQAYVKYHGLGGRLNGPVDNPISSCISCHGQGGVNNQGRVLPMANFRLTRQTFTDAEFDKYFANVKGGAYVRNFGGTDYNTTDYSLQLSAGIRNYYQNELFKSSISSSVLFSNTEIDTFSLQKVNELKNVILKLPEVSRGESEE
tara:strand:+ start:5622 stop:7103 length:1482 start_codon:yes stop_codon:yes gene_type:complete